MITPGQVGLTDNQNRPGSRALEYARRICYVAAAWGLPQRAAVIAVETALVETNLTMYANANNPTSLTLPHDAVGGDHGSVGLFQQQVGGAPNSTADWGSTAELMTPDGSAGAFYRRLIDWVGGDWGGTWLNGDAAQAVQGSAFPARYQQRDSDAARVVAGLWPEVVASLSQPTAPTGGGATAGEEDEDDMAFIVQSDNPGRPGLLVQGGRVLPITSLASAESLRAAGVRDVKLADRDYSALVNTWSHL